jgi:hypothetical protein
VPPPAPALSQRGYGDLQLKLQRCHRPLLDEISEVHSRNHFRKVAQISYWNVAVINVNVLSGFVLLTECVHVPRTSG